jgi:hypothetical protein
VLAGGAVLSTTSGDLHLRDGAGRWRRTSTGFPSRGLAQTSTAVFAAGAAGSIWRISVSPGSAPLEKAAIASLRIAPNPAGAFVDVDVPPSAGAGAIVRLANSDGERVRTIDVTGDRVRIATSDLPAGVYTIRVIARQREVVAQGRVVVVR